MRKILLYSSAFVAFTMSGVAEAACIQTPTCSSLGYTSSSSCSGGTKCPFGNAWNCTGPNNTTEINKLKTEISGIKTDITNIKTNITNLTNRITNIENNSGSGSGSGLCASCNVGDYICGGQCYRHYYDMDYNLCNQIVVDKTDAGVCRKISFSMSGTTMSLPLKTLTYDEFMKDAIIERDSSGKITKVTNSKMLDELKKVCNVELPLVNNYQNAGLFMPIYYLGDYGGIYGIGYSFSGDCNVRQIALGSGGDTGLEGYLKGLGKGSFGTIAITTFN